MELTDFRKDLLNQANTRASLDGVFTADAFMSVAADLLISAGEVDSLDLLSFCGVGVRQRTLAVNGFFHDEQDTSVALAVVRYEGGANTPSLSYTEAAGSLKSLQYYLESALSGDFLVDREPSMPEYQLAETLK